MENSRRSILPNEDSISMYLSFDTDADDTIASKWQSVMGSQTPQSQYLEVQQSIDLGHKLDQTLEEKVVLVEKKTVLKSVILNDMAKDHSPLRPFDQSLLNKHNALCSTPTKIKTLKDARQDLLALDTNNKENTQPDTDENTTLENTASTVKINTMFIEGNGTINEISMQENHNKTSNVYPLNADVLLENITEVSNEEISSPAAAVPAADVPAADVPALVVPALVVSAEEKRLEKQQAESVVVASMVNEVSELINKALKLTDAEHVLPQEQNQKQMLKLPIVAMPRPRRSFLPTSTGQSFKQRMSIVVKTTLNSPARKFMASNSAARRSFLPTARTSQVGVSGYRRSTAVRSTESAPLKQATTTATAPQDNVKPKPKPKTIGDGSQFKCQLCRTSFSAQSQLDLHKRKHMELKKPGACKFCDKKFALERALHIHLMQNCDKIPPAEKRKLQYTELNHVKKAQLPKLVAGSTTESSTSLKPRESSVGVVPSLVATTSAAMAPPSVSKMPKKVAHAGVYRTPTKTVPCHVCKQTFKSILDYTTHCLTVHSKSQKQGTAQD